MSRPKIGHVSLSISQNVMIRYAVELYDISFGFYCMPSREIIAIPVGTKLGARVARSCPYALLNQVVEASPDGMRSLPVTIRPVPSAAVYKVLSQLQIDSHNGGT